MLHLRAQGIGLRAPGRDPLPGEPATLQRGERGGLKHGAHGAGHRAEHRGRKLKTRNYGN